MKKLIIALLILFIPLIVYGADTEVQDLTDITSPATGDDMYIVDDPDGTPASRKINIGNLLGVAADLDTSGEVANDSHSHTGSSLSTVDISDDTNLTAGTNITLTGDTLNVDDAFVLTAGDTMTGSLTLASGQNIFNGANQLTLGDKLDGEQLGDNTVDDDSIDLADVTLADFTDDLGADPGHTHTTTSVSGLVDADMANNALDPDKLVGDATDDDLVDSSIVEQNAGTDISADLEEETHASEHAENAADELLVENLGTACTVNQVIKSDGSGGMDCGEDNNSGGGGGTTIDYQDSGSAIVSAGTLNATGNIQITDVGGVATITNADAFILNTGDTIAGHLVVDGIIDQVQLKVDCVVGQSADCFSVQDGASGDVVTMDRNGIVTAIGFTIGSAAITETELEILDDLTATTAELEELTDSSETTLHSHAGGGGGATKSYIHISPASMFITGTVAVVGDATQGAGIDGSNAGVLLFDETTDEGAAARIPLPSDWLSHGTFGLTYSMASGNADEVEWEIALMCLGSERDDADGFAAIASATETVPGTIFFPSTITITPTDDGCASGELMTVFVSTDSDDGNDNATGDRRLLGLIYEYNR